jgi:polyhydroxyalkanoate synthesis repressor PhaR
MNTRVIKRYSNRKLYDLDTSRYVTLQEVAAFLQEGQEVQIVDNKTGEDITSVTMAQILYEQEKQFKSSLPLQTLKGIIRTSGDALQKKLVTNVAAIRDGAEKTMSTFKEEAEKRIGKVGEDARTMVAGVGQVTQTAIDELTRAVDDRFKQLIGFPIIGSTQKEREPTVLERLDALEKKLEEMDAKLQALSAQRRR